MYGEKKVSLLHTKKKNRLACTKIIDRRYVVEQSVEIRCCIQVACLIGDIVRGKVSCWDRLNYGMLLFGVLVFRKTVPFHFQDARYITIQIEVIFSFEKQVSAIA
jgi:hypothetical protein